MASVTPKVQANPWLGNKMWSGDVVTTSPAASVYTPGQTPVPPHAQTLGSMETAASALLIADLQLTCPQGPQTARVQSRPRLPGTVKGPEWGGSLGGPF